MKNGEDDPPPGVVRWLISCDESGVHGSRHYGFGTLWMAWQRRGDFAALIRDLRRKHHYSHEIKWTNVKRGSLPFFREAVDEFFDTQWLSFHCLVVERAIVRREFHASWDEARQKHFTMLLQRKIRDCVRAHSKREQTFRVWLDPMHSAYPKAAEVAEIITRAIVSRHSNATLESVIERVSDSTESIQLCDLLLGAVMSAWEKDATAFAKLEIQNRIAQHLGWEDLCADTWPRERKFNVWLFFDTEKGRRRPLTRRVVLQRPLPVRSLPE